MEQNPNEKKPEISILGDAFDRRRESLSGRPGYQVRRSTIVSPASAWIPTATWFVETMRTDDDKAIFLQWVGHDGGQRMVVPEKVAECIYRHYEAIMKTRRSERAKRAAKTARERGHVPFGGKTGNQKQRESASE